MSLLIWALVVLIMMVATAASTGPYPQDRGEDR